MTHDLISDMLTRIRNASLAKHNFAFLPYSKLNISILKVLIKEGYLTNYEVINITEKKQIIKLFLKYKGHWKLKPLFSVIKRISKPGQRIFSGYKKFSKKVNLLNYSQGIAIISTSSGIMSHTKAIKLKKGGEIICYIA